MIFVFLWLTNFTYHNPLQFHPRSCKWQDFILFDCQVILPRIDIPHLYPFIHRWTLGSSHTLAVVDRAAINMGVRVSLRNSTPVCHRVSHFTLLSNKQGDTISGILAEDVRLLGQRQRNFTTQDRKELSWYQHFFLHQYSEAWFPQGDTWRASGHLCEWWVALQEKSPEFRVSESLHCIVSVAVLGSEERHSLPSKTISKPAPLLWRETLSSKYICCKNVLVINDSLEQRVPLLMWCVKLQETPGLYEGSTSKLHCRNLGDKWKR